MFFLLLSSMKNHHRRGGGKAPRSLNDDVKYVEHSDTRGFQRNNDFWWRRWFIVGFMSQFILSPGEALEARAALRLPAEHRRKGKVLMASSLADPKILFSYNPHRTSAQLPLRKVIHNDGAECIAHHVDCRTEAIAVKYRIDAMHNNAIQLWQSLTEANQLQWWLWRPQRVSQLYRAPWPL